MNSQNAMALTDVPEPIAPVNDPASLRDLSALKGVRTHWIAATPEVKDSLIRLFRVTERMVTGALSYERNTELARRIRAIALQLGATELEVSSPFTLHDSDGFMRQHFANGALLELSKSTGEGRAWFHGQLRQRWDNVKVAEIAAIQAEVQSWVI